MDTGGGGLTKDDRRWRWPDKMCRDNHLVNERQMGGDVPGDKR
jgi:hypothetical protein